LPNFQRFEPGAAVAIIVAPPFQSASKAQASERVRPGTNSAAHTRTPFHQVELRKRMAQEKEFPLHACRSPNVTAVCPRNGD
jgi:hypothetical protein